MATQADILGAGHTLTGPDGTEYTIKPPTKIQQATFQRWLERCAREKLLAAVEYDAETKRQQLADLEDRIAGGHFEWGSAACAARLRSPSGMSRILQILLDIDGPTADALVEHRLELIAALLVARAADDPKAVATILEKLGEPMPSPPPGTGSSHSSTRRGVGRRRKSVR